MMAFIFKSASSNDLSVWFVVILLIKGAAVTRANASSVVNMTGGSV